MPSLLELRQQQSLQGSGKATTTLREVVADVQDLHCDPVNAGAMFQVASQFNLLEMISPAVTPEAGVGIYQTDPTQGPACAMACGAGTIYRHYFVPIGDQIGQSAKCQLDCLAALGNQLGNTADQLWRMRNGYALPTSQGLSRIREQLQSADENRKDQLRGALQIGVHHNTQVTLRACRHVVTQAYCSALPVSYSRLDADSWEPFARLVLEAAYEATFHAAALNAQASGNNRLYLTLLGGGAFGNKTAWIVAAIERALRLHRHSGLEVAVVSFGSSRAFVRELTDRFTLHPDSHSPP